MLLPLSGENLHDVANISAEARLDISTRGIWLPGRSAFFDVRVFDPCTEVATKTRTFRNVMFRTKTEKKEVQSKGP